MSELDRPRQAGHAVPRVLRPESEATGDEVDAASGLGEIVDLVSQVDAELAGEVAVGPEVIDIEQVTMRCRHNHRVRVMCVG